MEKLIVDGGKTICGTATVSGAKNAVLPILAAAALTDKTIELYDCPNISDVYAMRDILVRMGARVDKKDSTIRLNSADISTCIIPENESRKMRSSIFLLGPILARFKKAIAVYPGGCNIGARPIDLHLKGLKSMNVNIVEADGKIFCDGQFMKPADIQLDFPSVGATENLMMAASGIDGLTTIRNAAQEPEIVDLQRFMQALGIKISGAGTSVIKIWGKSNISDSIVKYKIMPDRIVAGTLLAAAAITGGAICLNNARYEDLKAVLSKLEEMGCFITYKDETINLIAPKRLKGLERLETQPHPGFPTDMQAILCALCCVSDGVSVITENLYENRFRHVPELIKMGANISVNGRTIVVTGKSIHGAVVDACDLRAGAALIIAGLAAKGKTVVNDVDKYVDRGYDHIEKALVDLGADIIRKED